jgi:hexosaminidase
MDKGYSSIPNLLTECYGSDGKPNGETGPLRPDLDSTYAFLAKFYAEVKDVFPDKFVHVGGDEVPFGCWQSNPEITAFMKVRTLAKASTAARGCANAVSKNRAAKSL